jgi:septal ring factor EnvC (AmiA/AmiB activator)
MSDVELYREKYEAKLDEWEAEIMKLKAKARQEKSDASIDLQHKVDDLEAKHALLKEKLSKLSDDGDNAWRKIKSGIEKAGSDLSGSIKAAVHTFDKS